MISNLMSKDASVFIGLISVRRAVTIAMLLVVCALASWSHRATADEINATTTAKPVGFAEIVAKVKPAVIEAGINPGFACGLGYSVIRKSAPKQPVQRSTAAAPNARQKT